MIIQNPNLSIIVTSRNDNHDNTLLKRMRIFYTNLLYQLEKYKLPGELIIVEWNPPRNKPPLAMVLPKIEKNPYAKVKIITVPNSIHKRFPNSKVLGLYQFIAKNVGIRRAKGKFILVTNIDILFSSKVIEYLNKKKLDRGILLRSIRFDIPANINEKWPVSQRLQFCEKNAFNAYRPNNDSSIINFIRRTINNRVSEGIFTNACGDFTLLSKEAWFSLRGYPEFPLHGVKIDGLLVYQAFFAGSNQFILPENACIYHIEHENSWSSDKSITLQDKLRKKDIPFLTSEKYRNYIEKMRRGKGKFLFNDNTWGLKDENLVELIL